MVKGLDTFRGYFGGHADQFILIGGTAATLAMDGAGLEFRATKDLDIVLHIEALRPDFGSTFWEFVEKGGYQRRETSETGKPVLYRFQKPTDGRFPFMLELFCRSPDGIRLAESSRLTPIPFDESAWLRGTYQKYWKHRSGAGCDVKSVGVTGAVSTMLAPTVGILTFKGTAEGPIQSRRPFWDKWAPESVDDGSTTYSTKRYHRI